MAHIIEIGREGETVYGVRFALCTNKEVVRGRLGGLDDDDDIAVAAMQAAARSIDAAEFDSIEVSLFREYNGGPRHDLIEADWFVADLETDEDGTVQVGDWRAVWTAGAGATTIPEPIAAKAEAVIDSAMTAMIAEYEIQAAEEAPWRAANND